jgi:hypothetical protein
VGTFNFSAKYLSQKDSSTMLPELTEFVPATRMGIVRKVLLGLENRAGCIFSSTVPKDQVTYCHHLASASVVRRKLFKKSSPMKLLDQLKPNMV